MAQAVSEDAKVNRAVIRLIKGDITDLDIDAFVFYAQHDLVLGSGFGTAITIRGGSSVQKALDELGSLKTGEAVMTPAGDLKAEYIIHAVGPRFQEDDIEGKLRTTMRNSLVCAKEKGIKRLAFPAMGAGYYGILPGLCAKVMTEEIKHHLTGETKLEEVIICVFDSPQFGAFEGPVAAMS